jgi:N-acetylmuramoyl-L-alanine amidase
VREVRERLRSLGFDLEDAPVLDEPTRAALEAFQRSRGLPITGEVDATTWSRLVEAGWHLGARLLYGARPFLRGDDVAELQVRLARLGFNPGRIDGIFGAQTEIALVDFQQNRALEPSGTLSRATLDELLRMTARADASRLVTDARDEAGFDAVADGPVVITGAGPLARRVATRLGERLTVHHLPESPVDEVAEFANRHGARVVLAFALLDEVQGVHLHYWASYRSHSRRGERLATEIATELSRYRDLPRVEVTGMALPILRETRMTTVQVEYGEQRSEVIERVAGAIAAVITAVFHK